MNILAFVGNVDPLAKWDKTSLGCLHFRMGRRFNEVDFRFNAKGLNDGVTLCNILKPIALVYAVELDIVAV